MTSDDVHPNDAARIRHAIRVHPERTVAQVADAAGVDEAEVLIVLAGAGAHIDFAGRTLPQAA